jgi:hypothetical protein
VKYKYHNGHKDDTTCTTLFVSFVGFSFVLFVILKFLSRQLSDPPIRLIFTYIRLTKTNPTMRYCLLLLASIFSFATISAQTYTAHEWGTFTTLSGSDGILLPGLHIDEERLPEFTYGHVDIYTGEGAGDEKGFATQYQLSNVTVKMETPVIYFYATQGLDVNVKVGFPKGAISQWYPKRTSGEGLPSDLKIDFAKPFNGSIEWDATISPDINSPAYTTPEDQLTSTWTAPRETDANRVTVNDQVEKYLFYRGVANFGLPVKTSYVNGKLLIENTGAQNIPYVFVIEKKAGQTEPKIWWTGNVSANQSVTVNPQPTATGFTSGLQEFQAALVQAGLYDKEAAAMLKTWDKSYFHTDGIKVFWILPEQLTNEILPLTLTPAPESLKRVLVARSEVLSPEFEAELKNEFNNNDGAAYSGDRFYYAYKERVDAMNAKATGIEMYEEKSFADEVKIIPNPATGHIKVEWTWTKCLDCRITIIDAQGKIVNTSGQPIECNSQTATIDISVLPSGSYFVRIKSAEKELSIPFIKQ